MEKALGPSHQLVFSEPYEKLIKTLGAKCIIGHNRFATLGAKTVDNAHPFAFENVVGAHNGTVEPWSLKRLDTKLFDTDSQTIMASINDVGLQETLSKIWGAWALVWFDKTSNTINMTRNDKRPLFYTYTENRESIFWASEYEMLDYVLAREGIKRDREAFYDVTVDTHYSWVIPEIGKKFEQPNLTKVERPKTEVIVYNRRAWYDRDDYTYAEWEYDHNGKYVGRKSKHYVPPFQPDKKKKEVEVDPKNFRPPYKDHAGKIINKAQFCEIVEQGCVFCDDNTPVWGDFIKVLKPDMDGRKTFLCSNCYQDEDIKQLAEAYNG